MHKVFSVEFMFIVERRGRALVAMKRAGIKEHSVIEGTHTTHFFVNVTHFKTNLLISVLVNLSPAQLSSAQLN